jgi:AcrR family transcriptional regulator
MVEPRDERRRSRREDLLAAAAKRFLAAGVRRTTMAEVARRAGLSRSTVYTHFPDVTAAIAALLTRELRALTEEVAAATEAELTARQRLVARSVHMAARVPDDPLVERLLDLDAELLVPYLVTRLGSSQRALLDALAAEVAAGQADGSIRDGEPALLAFTVFLYMIKAREFLWELVEDVTGARLTISYGRVGGVKADLPDGFEAKVRTAFKQTREVLDEVHRLLTGTGSSWTAWSMWARSRARSSSNGSRRRPTGKSSAINCCRCSTDTRKATRSSCYRCCGR